VRWQGIGEASDLAPRGASRRPAWLGIERASSAPRGVEEERRGAETPPWRREGVRARVVERGRGLAGGADERTDEGREQGRTGS
jgi:hypothetical protein